MCRPLTELAQYRSKKGLSRKKLAEDFGVTETTIWRWETGERRPDREYISRVAELTGLSIATLTGVDE